MIKVAIIPARKGSQRLKGKNFMKLFGNPLIYYSIKFAVINNFDKIIVSTDDNEIKEYCRNFNVLVHNRSKEFSGDNSLIRDLLKEIISEFNLIDSELICLLQPTSPLREKNLFIDSYKIFETKKFDSVISVNKTRKKIGSINNHFFVPNYDIGSRTQDLNKNYEENGLIYLLKPLMILKGKIFGDKIGFNLCDNIFGRIDIDDIYDFSLCEIIFEKKIDKLKYLIL
tara:strand:+ start:3050 stop:3730 length:681 start_codon:yes stop_codon:yes gene_type:complete